MDERHDERLRRLREKLCRELAQSESSAMVHSRREARRLGAVPPAHALLAIADHAEQLRGRLEAAMGQDRGQRAGRSLGAAVGELFSLLRHAVFDRAIDVERSYRGTLLGVHHGIDCARLLREVAVRLGDQELVRGLDVLIAERASLVEQAAHALGYFADQPERALASGLRVALEPSPGRR
jgi:hypothetical protein